jgi:hypothetical protein
MSEANDPQIGEIVSALSRFAPEAQVRIRERNPQHELVLRRGMVLGNSSITLTCEVALEMLPRYGAAVRTVQISLRRRLRVSWQFDLISKIAATGGAGGALMSLLGQFSVSKSVAAAAVALIGGACTCSTLSNKETKQATRSSQPITK